MPKQVSSRTKSGKSVRVLRGTVFITRQVHFNSAHRLHNPTKSQAWNKKQYGLCTNPHWHGHNYVLEVTLRGEPDPVTGLPPNRKKRNPLMFFCPVTMRAMAVSDL